MKRSIDVLSFVRAALLGMAAMIASSAHAFQNYTMTANTFNIPSGTHVSNSVLCNPAQKVIGGGFTIAGATGTMRKYYATASEPSTALNGWNVAVQNNDVQIAKVVIYAICATGVEKHHRPFANWSLGPFSTTATASAVCLPGTRVLSGGFVISGSPPHLFYATRSRAVPSNWTADIRNNGTIASDSTSAVCALANSAAYGIFNSAFTVPAYGVFTQTRNCPPGRQILGGGFAITGATTAKYYATQSSPAQGSPGWTVTVQNKEPTPVNAIAYAICGL